MSGENEFLPSGTFDERIHFSGRDDGNHGILMPFSLDAYPLLFVNCALILCICGKVCLMGFSLQLYIMSSVPEGEIHPCKTPRLSTRKWQEVLGTKCRLIQRLIQTGLGQDGFV